MTTKTVSSTTAQNNFGRILDDVVLNDVRYIIKRRNTSQAILLSLSDFEQLLGAQEFERRELSNMIRELSPTYELGDPID